MTWQRPWNVAIQSTTRLTKSIVNPDKQNSSFIFSDRLQIQFHFLLNLFYFHFSVPIKDLEYPRIKSFRRFSQILFFEKNRGLEHTFLFINSILPSMLLHVLQDQGLLAECIVHVDQVAAGDGTDLKASSILSRTVANVMKILQQESNGIVSWVHYSNPNGITAQSSHT